MDNLKTKLRNNCTTASKGIEHIGINLSKEVHWKLQNIVKKKLNKWKGAHITYALVRSLYIIKMAILPKLISLNWSIHFLSKPAALFADVDKLIVKFIQKFKQLRVGKAILKKENKIGELKFPGFKIDYTVTGIKTGCYWHKERHIVH